MSVLRAIRAFPPHGWIAFGLQMLLLFCANAIYEVTRACLEGSTDVALAHAHDIIRAEKAMHIFVERDLQQWALDGPAFVIDAAELDVPELPAPDHLVVLHLAVPAPQPRSSRASATRSSRSTCWACSATGSTPPRRPA